MVEKPSLIRCHVSREMKREMNREGKDGRERTGGKAYGKDMIKS